MGNFQYIEVSHDNAVATVTMNRPDVHNAFNDEMIKEITGAFQSLGDDESVRVVILASYGKSFCAGADLNWMSRMMEYTYEENVIDALGLAKMLKTIHDCPKPVIARVHGAAFGGGVGLISACDFAVCVDTVLFGLTEVKLGIIPAVISPFVLKKLPPAAAQRYFMTAERFSAEEARHIGLIAEVRDSVEAMDECLNTIIKSILNNGPEAVAASKVLINEVLGTRWDETLQKVSEMIATRRISTEGQEGMKAFLEKRKPNWLNNNETVKS